MKASVAGECIDKVKTMEHYKNERFVLKGRIAKMTDIRLRKIFEEASKLFISKGYARTQMSFIAKASGISIGAIYSLFTSKQAIYAFVLKCVADKTYIEGEFELPIKEEDFSGLQEEIIELFKQSNRDFKKGLGDSSYCFEQMLSDAFDIISEYGVGFLIFQQNGSDSGELYNNYLSFRKAFCNDVEKYVDVFIQKGAIRKLDYPEYHARLIIETLSWWGMHVLYDAFETNSSISPEISKEVATSALKHAYLI